jgi:hypothetical protein
MPKSEKMRKEMKGKGIIIVISEKDKNNESKR